MLSVELAYNLQLFVCTETVVNTRTGITNHSLVRSGKPFKATTKRLLVSPVVLLRRQRCRGKGGFDFWRHLRSVVQIVACHRKNCLSALFVRHPRSRGQMHCRSYRQREGCALSPTPLPPHLNTQPALAPVHVADAENSTLGTAVPVQRLAASATGFCPTELIEMHRQFLPLGRY